MATSCRATRRKTNNTQTEKQNNSNTRAQVSTNKETMPQVRVLGPWVTTPATLLTFLCPQWDLFLFALCLLLCLHLLASFPSVALSCCCFLLDASWLLSSLVHVDCFPLVAYIVMFPHYEHRPLSHVYNGLDSCLYSSGVLSQLSPTILSIIPLPCDLLH